jgi:hypothetical protein
MQAPPLVARVRLAIDGVPVLLTREVTCRSQDQAVGEIREPIRLVPRIDVALEPDTIVWPADGAVEQRFVVTLRHNAQDSAAGTVALELDGWPAPPPQPFRLTRPGEALTSTFAVRRPAGVTRADVHVRAVVRTSDGGRFTRGVQRVTYSHIRPTGRVVPAEARVRVAPIALPAVDRIGYVRGASDRVPDALRHIGLPVELLDRETLASGDLSRFDVIVIGSRAYETDSALIRANDRLLAYVRAGGHLVVQYQQYPFVRGGYAPYALDIARPHDRITDETSPVTVLDPAQPVFQTPNRITSDDWDGWPQERGLYFAHTWDAAYRPMLEMRDPGQLPMRGGLLVARYGRGTYVYTGISFFRALPAGVPGAFRLFLNLLDLKGGDVP